MTPVRALRAAGHPAWWVAPLVAVVVLACGGTPVASDGGSPTPPPAVSTAPPAGAVTARATARPPDPTPDPDRPPAASLAVEGGDPVVGDLGAYSWAGGGSDSPWLPGAPIRVGAGEPLRVTLAGAPRTASWTVRAAAAPRVGTDGTRALGDGDGDRPIVFPAPRPGSWTVAVTVRFAAGGSATYYWRVEVAGTGSP